MPGREPLVLLPQGRIPGGGEPAFAGLAGGTGQGMDKFWTETLGQPAVNAFHVPFVTTRVATAAHWPGWRAGWLPVLIDETTPWVSQFRGLWGCSQKTPFRARTLRPDLCTTGRFAARLLVRPFGLRVSTKSHPPASSEHAGAGLPGISNDRPC